MRDKNGKMDCCDVVAGCCWQETRIQGRQRVELSNTLNSNKLNLFVKLFDLRVLNWVIVELVIEHGYGEVEKWSLPPLIFDIIITNR